MNQKEMDSLIAENDKRAIEAEGQRKVLYDLKISDFTIKEFLQLTQANSFTTMGQKIINQFYDKLINNQS